MKEYIPRLYDQVLKQRLLSKGAVLIEGPKWCGKTTTAEQIALVADEQRRVLVKLRQPFQHPAQNAGAQLGGAAAALTKQFFVTHKVPPYSVV